jgi:hypothetical protein
MGNEQQRHWSVRITVPRMHQCRPTLFFVVRRAEERVHPVHLPAKGFRLRPTRTIAL